jgi:hypothetical protein
MFKDLDFFVRGSDYPSFSLYFFTQSLLFALFNTTYAIVFLYGIIISACSFPSDIRHGRAT